MGVVFLPCDLVMPKQSKRTKKFQKDKLPGVIKQRREKQSKRKLYERRQASRDKRTQLRADRKEQLAAQREREEAAIQDHETFSDEDAEDLTLTQDVEDFMERLNEDGDSGDDDDLSDVSYDEDEIEQFAQDMDDDASADPNHSLRSSVEAHKAELEKLKESDPSFYKYLQENDAELLAFAEDADDLDDDEGMDELDDEEDDDEEDDQPSTKRSRNNRGPIVLTMEMIDDMIQKVSSTQSTRHMKQLVVAYKAGCNFREGEANDDDQLPFIVPNSDVFNHLMVTGIAEFPLLFHSLFGVEEKHKLEESQFQEQAAPTKKKGKEKITRLQTRITKSERWKKLQSCVRSYLKSTLVLLDGMTDQQIIAFILRRINQNLLVYYACVPHIAQKLLRTLCRFWSSAEETNRILAFIALRELTILTPYPFIDVALKALYLTFAKNAKFTNRATMANVQFMCNCVVEMFGLDFKASYQHAFSHIRVLAVKLRNAIISKTQEHFTMIHSWQFFHSLQMWTAVLCTYSEQSDLQMLVYPLVQVISGAIQLLPVQRYYPYHFLCVRLLQQLARSSNLFIPTLPFLLRVLECPEFRKKFKPSTEKPIDWACTLKAPNKLLHTRVLFDGIVEQVFELLLEHFAIYAYSISLPEMSIPTILTLKRFAKHCKIPEYAKTFRQLCQQIENGAQFIRSHRMKVDFAPKDFEKADHFLQEKKEQMKSPLSKYHEQQKIYREKSREEDTLESVFDLPPSAMDEDDDE